MTFYTSQALPGPPNNPPSQATGINSNAFVAGFAFPSLPPGEIPLVFEAMIWTKSGAIAVSVPVPSPGVSGLAAVNDNYVNGFPDAVGAMGPSIDEGEQSAILLRGGNVHVLNGALLGPGSQAVDINNAGMICANSGQYPGAAVLYDSNADQVATVIPPLPGDLASAVWAINNAAPFTAACGSYSSQGVRTGFIFSNGTSTPLGQIWRVTDVNDSGLVVGSVVDGQSLFPAAWDTTQTPPAMLPVPLPSNFSQGEALAVNNQGLIVGYGYTASGLSAFVYDGNSATDLNSILISIPGWFLQEATDINDNGEIAGYGTFNGQETAFLLTPKHVLTRPPGPGRPINLPRGVLGLVATILLGGAPEGGSGTAVVGGIPMPVPPSGPAFQALDSATADVLIGLTMNEMAKSISDPSVRASLQNAILAGVGASVEQLSREVSRLPQSAAATSPHTPQHRHKLRYVRHSRGH